jgi:DNA polymerase-3 subunit epsilon
MLIVAVDVETTGLNSEEDEVVELGAVLFCTVSKRVLAAFNKVYKVNKWSSEAEQCHKIPEEMSNIMPLIGSEDIDPWAVVSGDLAKYVVAHNAKHDHPFVTKIWPSFKQRPWLCTFEDLPHHLMIKVSSNRLGHLCVDYGITMGTWHQALADAEACARIAAFHELDEAYGRKIIPKFRLVTYGDYLSDIRDVMGNAPSVLKDGHRYRWNQEEAPRAWMKDGLTIEEIEEDAKYLKEVTKGKWKFEGAPLPPKPY